jgi:hypothetical protein
LVLAVLFPLIVPGTTHAASGKASAWEFSFSWFGVQPSVDGLVLAGLSEKVSVANGCRQVTVEGSAHLWAQGSEVRLVSLTSLWEVRGFGFRGISVSPGGPSVGIIASEKTITWETVGEVAPGIVAQEYPPGQPITAKVGRLGQITGLHRMVVGLYRQGTREFRVVMEQNRRFGTDCRDLGP